MRISTLTAIFIDPDNQVNRQSVSAEFSPDPAVFEGTLPAGLQ